LFWFFSICRRNNEAFSGTVIVEIFYTVILKKVKCLFSVGTARAAPLFVCIRLKHESL